MNGIPETYRGKPLVHFWQYHAKDGSLLDLLVARYQTGTEKKVYIPYSKCNGSGWTPGIKQTPRPLPLYGLDMLETQPKHKPVFITEGEKCAFSLQSLGVAALTSLGGAQAAKQANWSVLNGYKQIYLLPDNNEAGECYSQDIYQQLMCLESPPQIKLLRLSGLPAKGDVVNWIQALITGWNGYTPIPEIHHEGLKNALRDELKNAIPVPESWNKTGSADTEIFFPDENLSNHVHNVNNVHTVDSSKDAIEKAKAIIDSALLECKNNPGILGSDDFASAINLVSADMALWFEYRTKIKAAKPAGVPMTAIDGMAAPQSGDGDKQNSTASLLIKLVLDSCQLFFDSHADKAFVHVEIAGVGNTLSIGSKTFVEWLSFAYYTWTKSDDGPGQSASEASIKQACFALAGIAKHEGQDQRVHLRVADCNGGHYLFIGDEKLQVIEVLPTGWRVLDNAPIKFWAPGSMQALPIPLQDGDLSKVWEFVNIPEQDRLLVLAWMLESFREETPFPILAISGQQGSAKSSTQDKLRQLNDNNAVNLRAAPKSIEDVFVSAGCNWLASFENISHLTPAMQDALCTLATGGGLATRTLYTNSEETIIEVKRPVIINSIPPVITAQDLTDRSIGIELPCIAFREESEINAAWEEAKSSIFGGLLDLFVITLTLMPKVKLIKPPRMADFTRLGEAMAQALGYSEGTFDALYKANRAESIGRALEASPTATAIRDLVYSYNGLSPLVFTGTMKSLLEMLDGHKQESHAWPKSPRGLGDVLRRQQPALSSIGIDVIISKPGREGVIVEIRKREHCELREHVLTDFHAERKKTTPDLVVFEDTERF